MNASINAIYLTIFSIFPPFLDVNDDSVIHALKLLYPKLENQLLLAKQVALIEALKDLASHEEDTSFFAPEYLHILNNAETLMAEFKRQPAKLERLYGKIARLLFLHKRVEVEEASRI